MRIIFLLLFLISFSFTSAAKAYDKYEFLLHKSFAERAPLFDTAVLQKLKKQPEKYFYKELDEIMALAKNNADDGLYIEALLGVWYYKTMNDLWQDDHGETELKEILDLAKKNKLKKYIILARFELGNMYYHKFHDYDRAFTILINNYSKFADIPAKEMPNKKAMVLHAGHAYYHFSDYAEAKKYLLIADTIGYSWRPRVDIQCKNTLGLIYRNAEQYDSAIYYFEQAIDIAKKNPKEKIWVSIITGNIGISYYNQKNYTKAIPLLKKDVDSCLAYGVGAYGNGVNSLVFLTDSYIEAGYLDSASLYLDIGWYYLDSTLDKLKHLPKLYGIAAKLNHRRGDYQTALTFTDSSNYFNDSLLKRDNYIQIAKVQNKIKQQLHDKEVKTLNIEKQLISNTRNALIAVLILLAIIAYLIINRQRIKHNANKALLTSEKKLTETKLESAKRELENYTTSLQEKNALIEKSGKELERLQSKLSETERSDQDTKVIQQLYASTILTDEEWEEFKQLFDKVYAGFLHRLKEKMPELSPADTRFIVLSKLNLNNKEMAGILGVQPDTIRSYKHRLRKKYNLPDDSVIKEFIDSI